MGTGQTAKFCIAVSLQQCVARAPGASIASPRPCSGRTDRRAPKELEGDAPCAAQFPKRRRRGRSGDANEGGGLRASLRRFPCGHAPRVAAAGRLCLVVC